MTRFLVDLLTRSQKNMIRSLLRKIRLQIVRLFAAYDNTGLIAALRSLGVKEGDAVMVHSAFGEEYGFRGSLRELIDAFLTAIGRNGSLLMVSMPYAGSALEYLRSDRTFDVRKTPSAMGLVTEAFRRMSAVKRSANPMHPVLACGSEAEFFVAGHEFCEYSCGPATPFEKLLQRNGKVLFFNTQLTHFTFFHYLEHRAREKLPVVLYHEPAFDASVVDATGMSIKVRVYAYSAETIARRRDTVLHDWLEKKGVVRRAKIGATNLILLDLQEVVAAFDEMTAAGLYFYDPAVI